MRIYWANELFVGYCLQSWLVRHLKDPSLILVNLILRWMSCKPLFCFMIFLLKFGGYNVFYLYFIVRIVCTIYWLLFILNYLVPYDVEFVCLMSAGSQLKDKISLPHMMRCMKLLMLWIWRRTFWGVFMHMVSALKTAILFMLNLSVWCCTMKHNLEIFLAAWVYICKHLKYFQCLNRSI